MSGRTPQSLEERANGTTQRGKIKKKSKGKGHNKPHHIGKKGQAGGQTVKLLLSLHPEHRALT